MRDYQSQFCRDALEALLDALYKEFPEKFPIGIREQAEIALQAVDEYDGKLS